MNPQIRWLLRRDMPQIQNIERHNSHQPWTETRYLHALKQQRCIGLVVQERQQVIGIMIYRKQPQRFEIVHLLVAPNNRRKASAHNCSTTLKTSCRNNAEKRFPSSLANSIFRPSSF